MLTFAIVVVYILIIFWFQWKCSKNLKEKSKAPPGPPKFPILGHLPLLGMKPHVTLAKWKKTYGPIISVQFGSMRMVALNDAKLIKEAFNQPVFAGRPYILMYDKILGGKKGVSLNDGQDAFDQRRIVLQSFQKFRSTMEQKMLDGVDQLLVDLGAQSQTGQPVSMMHRINAPVLNVLCSILMGQKFDSDDPELIEMVKNVEASSNDFSILTSLAIAIPWIGDLFPNFSGITKVIESMLKVMEVVDGHIEAHKANRIRGQPVDFTDLYLDKVDDTKDPLSSFHADSNQQRLTTAEIIAAGVETTVSTLEWLIAYLVHHPEIQVKLHQEIDQVIGHSRRPNLNDRPQMAYTEAVLNETMRLSSNSPFGLFHRTMDDVHFAGYHIPKDTVIMSNFYCVNHDPDVWGDPDQFRPERFLDADGHLIKFDHFLPFSVGRRRCLGEDIARNSLFLFCAGLFQKFEILKSDHLPPLDSNKIAFVLAPQSFEVVLRERVI